ncbi:MAG TPA: DUF1501 domain-containing protein [Gemmataceae bacterium]|jgi:hypothetical protein
MLSICDHLRLRGRDGISRRAFLRAGTLGVGGLSLAHLLRLKAQGAQQSSSSHKSVIMIYLCGAPSHQDMYDMKPDAAAEYRGEFKPIKTNVPGMEICELMPLQAKIADKLAIIRNLRALATDTHMPEELLSGFPFGPSGGPASLKPGLRPTFGSVVSKLHPSNGTNLPPYVTLDMGRMPHGYGRPASLEPAFLGHAHQPFDPSAPGGVANLRLAAATTLDRLADRQKLLDVFDGISRDLEYAKGTFAGMDAFTAQALEIIRSPRVRDAFDLDKEPAIVRAQYGTHSRFLQARRLVEAGVKVVTVLAPGYWDTHANNFKSLRQLLPALDKAIFALVTDLHERGLDKEVAVVIWGEYGRTPKINKNAGRDHWPQASFALVAGGGFKMGQVIGATSPRAERPVGESYIPQNVLATLYQEVFGIDLATTLPDHTGRPVHLLEDTKLVKELL